MKVTKLLITWKYIHLIITITRTKKVNYHLAVLREQPVPQTLFNLWLLNYQGKRNEFAMIKIWPVKPTKKHLHSLSVTRITFFLLRRNRFLEISLFDLQIACDLSPEVDIMFNGVVPKLYHWEGGMWQHCFGLKMIQFWDPGLSGNNHPVLILKFIFMLQVFVLISTCNIHRSVAIKAQKKIKGSWTFNW